MNYPLKFRVVDLGLRILHSRRLSGGKSVPQATPDTLNRTAGPTSKVGLVLGGGWVRGVAHLGVLQALEAAGLHPYCVVGSSAGAVVGGLYAAGVPIPAMLTLARELDWHDVASFTIPGLGLFDMTRMERRIEEMMGQAMTFDQLQVPFAAMTTDVVTGAPVVVREGRVAAAIRASSTVPGLMVPRRIGGRLLVDGAIVNTMPVSVARTMGADYVVAVDLLPPGTAHPKEPANMIEMILATMRILMRATSDEVEDAERVIMPPIGHIGLLDLEAVEELFEAGLAAAQAMLPQIRQDLERPGAD